MTVVRRGQIKRRENHELAWRIGKVILAAQHVRDAHARIIHRIAEKERGRSVRAPHDKVADVVAQKALRAVHEIHEFDAFAGGHAKAQSWNETALEAARALSGVKVAAGGGGAGGRFGPPPAGAP